MLASERTAGHVRSGSFAADLKRPKRRGPAERDLNIEREASYIIAVKNPKAPSPPNAGLAAHERAQFPKFLQDKFQGRRFLPVDPPEFLDHEGAELMLIGARENPEQELGIAFEPDKEGAHHADVFKVLKLPRDVAREPLFEGRWK